MFPIPSTTEVYSCRRLFLCLQAPFITLWYLLYYTRDAQHIPHTVLCVWANHTTGPILYMTALGSLCTMGKKKKKSHGSAGTVTGVWMVAFIPSHPPSCASCRWPLGPGCNIQVHLVIVMATCCSHAHQAFFCFPFLVPPAPHCIGWLVRCPCMPCHPEQCGFISFSFGTSLQPYARKQGLHHDLAPA